MKQQNGVGIPETVTVTLNTRDGEQVFQCPLPAGYRALRIGVRTPKEIVVMDILKTRQGMKRILWEWDVETRACLRRVEE